MEDIDKSISALQELIRCNDVEKVRKLKRKFEDLVEPTEKTNLDYESLALIDELNEQTKAFVLKVEKLSGRGMFPEGIALDVFEEKRGDILPTSKLAGQTTAIRNMEKIYDFIIGDVRKIGVYGMGGIGKTTVMKHINNRILKEQKDKFDCVIWVTVSKESSVFKLQDDIACKLEVNLSNYKDTTTRAGALFKAFQKKGRYLLILDDLWEGYLLEDVGIPDPDIPDYANGCKLALTTRSFDVCQSMKCEAIHMDLLLEEEAWSLFLHHVGRYVLEIKDLVPIVRDVAMECACLPLAVATIATSMAGKKEVCDWKDALLELRAFSKEPGDKGKRVIEQLKFSYDRLEKKRLQKCLLLCAFYPEDFYIERRELVELLALEGIIDEKESMRDEIDKGNAMLNHLINQCLLEGAITSKEDSWVKMHDLVRDMALQIDGLHSQYLAVSDIELSDIKWSNDLLKIHISKCYSSNNVSPMCPRLTTFILRDAFLRNISDSFFQHFKALKVLNLSGCYSLQVLPNSISDLVNLVGLFLIGCYNLTHVSSLARLKDLRTLNFSLENKINPHLSVKNHFLFESLEELSNLRYVNLMSWLIEVFPSGIIPRLSNLRCLVFSSITKVSASELMSLKKLEMFKGAFHNIHDLRVYVKHIEQKRSRLTSYVFIVGLTFGSSTDWGHYENNSTEKLVLLINCSLGKLAESNEYLLPKDVQTLEIVGMPDLTSLCALTSLNLESLIGRKKQAFNVFSCLRELNIKGCPRMKVVFNIGLLSNLNNLEILKVHFCEELEEIIGESGDDEKDVNEGMTEITLPKLRILWLKHLPHLRSICTASRPLICKSLESFNVFPCLQQLEIKKCDRMKVVFNIGLFSNLNNLEMLDVRNCKELEEIIGESLDDEKDVYECMTEITLPKLRKLKLQKLPRLRSICPASRRLICKSLESINVFSCLEHLYIYECSRMKVVFNIGLLSNLNNLEELSIQMCDELEEIIGESLDDEKDVNESMTEITLPKLSVLTFWYLPHLRSICPASRLLICKSLKKIEIHVCPKLEQYVYVAWDESGQPSLSDTDTLRPIELKSLVLKGRKKERRERKRKEDSLLTTKTPLEEQ